ncbi:unnamed protein product [Pieris brassicae]|uniref:Uncharacterized protein n=1 Tax=Pieris brassicae TaxID=7116 RepID=A0A9P0T566_PIEBR|nr:unnamed protein product [Pieris brassicae]
MGPRDILDYPDPMGIKDHTRAAALLDPFRLGYAHVKDPEEDPGEDRETDPEENQVEDPGEDLGTGPEENQEEDLGAGPEENQEEDLGTGPEENQKADPGEDREAGSEENLEEDLGTGPEENQGVVPGEDRGMNLEMDPVFRINQTGSYNMETTDVVISVVTIDYYYEYNNFLNI